MRGPCSTARASGFSVRVPVSTACVLDFATSAPSLIVRALIILQSPCSTTRVPVQTPPLSPQSHRPSLCSTKRAQGSIGPAQAPVPRSDSPVSQPELPVLPPGSTAPQQAELPVTLPEPSGSPRPNTPFHYPISPFESHIPSPEP